MFIGIPVLVVQLRNGLVIVGRVLYHWQVFAVLTLTEQARAGHDVATNSKAGQ
jgi:hypothetical protein